MLAKQKFNLRERDITTLGATFVPFSAQTRMSGVDLEGREIRKGAADAIRAYVEPQGRHVSAGGGSRASTTSRGAAARRWWSPTARACSA